MTTITPVTRLLLARLDWEVASEASLEEVNKELQLMGENPDTLIKEVHQRIDHLQKNAEVARGMDLATAHLRVRLLAITAIAVLAFIGFCVVGWLIIVGALSGEKEKLLASLILIACLGVVAAAVVAFVSLLWNAFVYQAILARAAQRESEALTEALEDLYRRNPSVTDLIRRHFEQSFSIRHRFSFCRDS